MSWNNPRSLWDAANRVLQISASVRALAMTMMKCDLATTRLHTHPRRDNASAHGEGAHRGDTWAPRERRDRELKVDIHRVWDENFEVYGARKVTAAESRGYRCGTLHSRAADACPRSHGATRGRKCRTTIADDRAERPLARVNRQFQATRPNELWVADFTNVATWAAFVYVAFVIDVFARRIIGWRVARSMDAELVLDAGTGDLVALGT